MRWFDIRRGEWMPLAWAAIWFFCVLAAYYAIRPVRESFATQLSRGERADLFTWTLVVMLIVTPLYGLIVARVARRWLVPIVYGFFIANLVVFWTLLVGLEGTVPSWLSKTFFVWISVFNLFIVTLFWGTIVDLFTGEQGTRLFGLIFGAGTLGQLVSSWSVGKFSTQWGTAGLMWLSVALLAAAIFASFHLRRRLHPLNQGEEKIAMSGEGTWTLAWKGVVAVARSPYLLGIAAFIVMLSVCATVVYFQMTDIVQAQIAEESDRVRWFADINAKHAVVTLLMQTAIVGWLLRTIGVGFTMALVPLVFCAGFLTLAIAPTLFAVGIFQVALRAASFSLGNPAIEVLYTAVAPAEKYRAKAFIDTVGKRTGDVLCAQATALLGGWGWAIATMSLAMLPVVAGAFVLCLLLGSAHRQATVTVEKLSTGTGGSE